LHECPHGLLSDSVSIQNPGNVARKTVSHGFGQQIADGIKRLQGAEISNDGIALAAEIVSLANSLDEMLE
jgi:hypothetical protein